MSLEKAILHKKEHRKPYYKSASFDTSCRPRGGCPHCERGRLRYKRMDALKEKEVKAEVNGYNL